MGFLEEVTNKLYSERRELARRRGRKGMPFSENHRARRKQGAQQRVWEGPSSLCFAIMLVAPAALGLVDMVSDNSRKQSS